MPQGIAMRAMQSNAIRISRVIPNLRQRERRRLLLAAASGLEAEDLGCLSMCQTPVRQKPTAVLPNWRANGAPRPQVQMGQVRSRKRRRYAGLRFGFFDFWMELRMPIISTAAS